MATYTGGRVSPSKVENKKPAPPETFCQTEADGRGSSSHHHRSFLDGIHRHNV